MKRLLLLILCASLLLCACALRTPSAPDTDASPPTDTTAPDTTKPPITEPPETNPPETEPTHEVTVVDGVTYMDGILIVNKTYALPDTYVSPWMTEETAAAYNRMAAAAEADGISLKVLSAYRSYYDQRWIYNDYLNYNSADVVDTFSARPGHSEHQSGMALDLCQLSDDFGNTPAGLWLAAHAPEYGFILRYPAGKEHITCYKYEPWHFRYVGVELATYLTENALTLEEHFSITSVYAGPYEQ